LISAGPGRPGGRPDLECFSHRSAILRGFRRPARVIVHPRPCHTRVRDVPGHGGGTKKGFREALKTRLLPSLRERTRTVVSENASKTTAYRGTRILIPHANEAPFPDSARPLLLVLPSPPAAAAAAAVLSSLGSFTEFHRVEFRRSACPSPSPPSPLASCPTPSRNGCETCGRGGRRIISAQFRGEGASFPEDR